MGVRLRLVLASALMLFVELSLIRWLGANLVHLAYFSNFVLLGSFLGVGLGFLRASRDNGPARPPPYYALVVLLGLIGFVSAYPVTVDRSSTQVMFFTNISTSGPPIWLVLPAVFLSVAAVTAGPGRDRRRVLPRPAPAAGLPLRPDRQPVRHRVVHRPVFLRFAAAGLVRDRGRAVRRAAGTGPAPG